MLAILITVMRLILHVNAFKYRHFGGIVAS